MRAQVNSEAATDGRLRVGFFGVFYPSSERAGSFSTSLAWEMARSPRVASVRVFGPTASTLPPGGDPERLMVEAAWAFDDPVSVIHATRRMRQARREIDVYLFSIYVTAFGRRPLANVVGLLAPALLAMSTGKPVFVYMHNFLETQDVATLGYRVGTVTRVGVRMLERFLTTRTRVVVPLESMRNVVEREIRGRSEVLVLPYLEAAFAATRPGSPAPESLRAEPAPPIRILLFGYWGPQKDLAGALRVLGALVAEGTEVDVTVAGEANPGFPEYAEEIARLQATLPAEHFHFVGRVAEEDVFPLARRHHVLLLPYRATGGISGVMNVGALADLDLIAYDVPQLREFAREIGETVRFISPHDDAALRDAVIQCIRERSGPNARSDKVTAKLEAAKGGVERFIDLLRAPRAPPALTK